jgi:glycine cleavage system aminomethyltransferase T
VLAQRITYVGEYGYELYVARDDAVAVWDFLLEAVCPEPVGYQALDSLRIEKGYRYFGTDLTGSDTPFESGVGFVVAKGKHPELDRNPPTRLRTLLVGGEEYVTLYGGEAVRADGEVIGRVRSAAYGFTVARNVALAKLPAQLAEGAEVQVDIFGELVPAVVAADVLYDAGNERLRS